MKKILVLTAIVAILGLTSCAHYEPLTTHSRATIKHQAIYIGQMQDEMIKILGAPDYSGNGGHPSEFVFFYGQYVITTRGGAISEICHNPNIKMPLAP